MRADVAVSRQVGGLLVLFMAGFVAITTGAVPIGLLPAMSRSLHASEASIGLLVGASALVVMLATLPLVVLTSRWPRRRLLFLMSGFAASNLIVAAAPGYVAAMVARVVAACGHGVLWSTLPAYAALLVAPHRAGKAIAAVFAANSASLALGVPLGTVAGGALGWRMPFAALAVLVMLGARAGLPELPGQAGRALAISDALVLASRRILAPTGLVMLGHFALLTFVAPVLLDAGLSGARIGSALFAFGLAGIIGIVAAGIAVDRAPRTALVSALARMTISTMTLTATHGRATVVAVAAWGGSLRSAADTVANVDHQGRSAPGSRGVRAVHHHLQREHHDWVAPGRPIAELGRVVLAAGGGHRTHRGRGSQLPLRPLRSASRQATVNTRIRYLDADRLGGSRQHAGRSVDSRGDRRPPHYLRGPSCGSMPTRCG